MEGKGKGAREDRCDCRLKSEGKRGGIPSLVCPMSSLFLSLRAHDLGFEAGAVGKMGEW